MRYLCVLFLFAFSLNIQAQGINFEKGSWKEVQAKAKKSGAPIMLDCYAVWCGPCKKMAAEVFPASKVGEYYNKQFLNYKLDMKKGDGLAVAEKYQIKNYPTILFLNPDGSVMYKRVGAMNEEDFLALGKRAINPENQMAWLQEMQAKKTMLAPPLLKNLVIAKADAYEDYNAEVAQLDTVMSMEEWAKPENRDFFMDYVHNPDTRVFETFLQSKPIWEKDYGKDKVDAKINRAFVTGVRKIAPKNDEMELMNLVQRFYQPGPEDPMIMEVKASYGRYLMASFNKNKEEAKWLGFEYANHLVASQSLSPAEARFLNGQAWNVYEKEGELEPHELPLALDWINAALRVEENYAFTDTKAALLFKSGDKDGGQTWAKKAIELAKEEGIDPSETKALLEKYK